MSIKKHKNIFNNISQKYLSISDPAYKLKFRHTYEVIKITTLLAKKLSLNSKEVHIAKLAALYHDLGRFYQYGAYKTFHDSQSINHAEASIKIIEEHSILNDLDKSLKHLIIIAIREHNQKIISNNLNDTEKSFSQLLRDSDKISNFPVFIKNYDNYIRPISGIYRNDLIDAILNFIPISNVQNNLITVEDIYLYHLSWFNDLTYLASFEYVAEVQYIDKILIKVSNNKVHATLSKHFIDLKNGYRFSKKFGDP
ncbi:MAG: HD domain-containing protein [Chthoniobacterales bacterium]